VLDPTWAALATALEAPVVGALVKVSFDIPRLDDMRLQATTAKSSAHALFVTTAVLALHAAVDATRRPEQRTPDGVVPAESFEDALARGGFEQEFDEIVRAVKLKSEPVENVRRCRRRAWILVIALVLLVIAIPLALWRHLWTTQGGPASAPTIFYIALGAAAAFAVLCGGMYVVSRIALSRSIANAKGAEK
jgi:hypothetical protein